MKCLNSIWVFLFSFFFILDLLLNKHTDIYKCSVSVRAFATFYAKIIVEKKQNRWKKKYVSSRLICSEMNVSIGNKNPSLLNFLFFIFFMENISIKFEYIAWISGMWRSVEVAILQRYWLLWEIGKNYISEESTYNKYFRLRIMNERYQKWMMEGIHIHFTEFAIVSGLRKSLQLVISDKDVWQLSLFSYTYKSNRIQNKF